MSGDLEPCIAMTCELPIEDRDAIVDRLRVAAGTAGSTPRSSTQRIETAAHARTYGELAVVVRDLPESRRGERALGRQAGPRPH